MKANRIGADPVIMRTSLVVRQLVSEPSLTCPTSQTNALHPKYDRRRTRVEKPRTMITKTIKKKQPLRGVKQIKPRLSVVIPAHNEARTIFTLVRRLRKWRYHPEVIVVANGCTDGTARRAKAAGARVIQFTTKLGPDAGRAIGLHFASAKAILVLDADFLLPLSSLHPFVEAVRRNYADVALNAYPHFGHRRARHATATAKRALNLFANRPTLRYSSLITVPHCLSRRAVVALGCESFMVPPVAQVKALLHHDLVVKVVGHVDVGSRNRYRGHGHQSRMHDLIIGDILEAISVLLQSTGDHRGGFTDLERRRDVLAKAIARKRRRDELVALVLPEHAPHAHHDEPSVAAIIPTQGENTLPSVLQALESGSVDEIDLVRNGDVAKAQKSYLKAVASELPDFAKIRDLRYRQRLGHDVGRAIGALRSHGERLLFVDADIVLKRSDIKAILSPLDSADVSLNRLDAILTPREKMDPVSIAKRFLNLACGTKALGMASLTAVPHAIHESVLRAIGEDAFAVPPLAQVKLVLGGYHLTAEHAVDVIRTNRYRPNLHSPGSNRPMQHLILGDHLEALHFLLQQRGSRGGFEDGMRRRDVVHRFLAKHAP